MHIYKNQKDNVGLAIILTLCAYTIHVVGDTVLKLLSETGNFNAFAFIFLFSSLICTLGYMAFTRQLHKLRRKPPKAMLVRGGFAALAMWATFFNIQHMALSEIYALGFVIPAVAVGMARLLLKEKPTITAMLALGLGIMGAITIFQPPANLSAEGWMMAAVRIVAAASCVVLTRSCRAENPFAISTYSLVIVTAIVLPFAWEQLPLVTVNEVMACVGIGVISTVATQASIRSVQLAPVGVTAPAAYYKFALGIGVGFVIWDHVPSHAMMIGVVFAVLSSLLVTLQLKTEPLLQRALTATLAVVTRQRAAAPVRH